MQRTVKSFLSLLSACLLVGCAATADELASIYSEIQLKIVNELPILGMYFHTGAVISTAGVRALHGVAELNTWRGMELVEP